MRTFTIDNEYNINTRESGAGSEQDTILGAGQFSNIDELKQMGFWQSYRTGGIQRVGSQVVFAILCK